MSIHTIAIATRISIRSVTMLRGSSFLFKKEEHFKNRINHTSRITSLNLLNSNKNNLEHIRDTGTENAIVILSL